MRPILETTARTRRLGHFTAVDGVTLAVQARLFSLLGANGAGNTVTIKRLTPLLPPASGEACIAGFDVGRRAADGRRAIGYVPQMISADGALTGYESLMIFARLLDEPTVGLDPIAREAVWTHVEGLRVAIMRRATLMVVGAPAPLEAPNGSAS